MESLSNADLLTREQAAEFLGLKPQTLAFYATRRPSPIPFIKRLSRVFYRRVDLEEYLERNTRVVAAK